MSTVMKNDTGPIVPPPAKQPQDDKQLRSDRWTAIVVVSVMIALMALIIWLASLSGVEYESIDYWHMMP
ncbi:MAG: hypothetical protein CMJ64_12225 [Planctomycetaceae bacterium]|jgi:hypothetical protein|nr:hypothetical protein [Planctomycetaceae bacterium]